MEKLASSAAGRAGIDQLSDIGVAGCDNAIERRIDLFKAN